jgi:murein endopeptidase
MLAAYLHRLSPDLRAECANGMLVANGRMPSGWVGKWHRFHRSHRSP